MGIIKKVGIGIGAVLVILFVFGIIHASLNPTGEVTKVSNENSQSEQVTSKQCISNWQCTNWSECTLEGEHSRTCTDSNGCQTTSGKPAEKEKCAVTFETIKSNALTVSYGDLMRSPDNYKGKIVHYRGEVVQVMENGGDSYVLRVAVTRGEYRIWTDIIWVNYQGSRVLENDIVELWGRVKGLKTYDAVLGNSVTIPELDALYLNVVFKAELQATCGKTGNICCDNNDCDYGNICINNVCQEYGGKNQPCGPNNACDYGSICVNNVCQECGKDGQISCADGCSYGYELVGGSCTKECSYSQIRVNGVCQECGGDNQIPCEDNKCDYGYELINGKCIKECGYNQIRISGTCTDCGGLNEPCCSDSECDYGKVCKNSICVNCGEEAGQPCCSGEYKCSSYPTTMCVNDVCEYCGREGEQCCENNKCNSGNICKSGKCEECGGLYEQCCSPDNPYICFIGSCESGICVY